MRNVPSHVLEGIRTQASFVLQKWRRRVVLGFNEHHPWVAVAGLDKLLRYIPKSEGGYPLFFFLKKKKILLNIWFGLAFIADKLTPEAVMSAVICGVNCGIEQTKERSDLLPLPT